MAIDLLESPEDKYKIDIPKEKRELETTAYDYGVDYLFQLMSGEKPKIILEVPFQRKFIWKDERASQLIESVILNVPIPPLYFAEEEDGSWLIVDGLQRLKSILRFYQNEYKLKGLDIIKELIGLKYKDLPPKSKALLDSGQLRINVIKKKSHPDIKFDIFMRLNKGAVNLNYQELRNCLYRGALNDMVKEYTKTDKVFQKILNLKNSHPRYLDVEFVMRVLAMKENLKLDDDGNYIIDNYTGRMVKYINDFMSKTSKLTDEEAKGYLDLFKTIIAKVISVFGTALAFKDIRTSSLRFSKPLAEIICISFDKYDLETLESKKQEIIDCLGSILNNKDNKDYVLFQNSLSQRTSDTDMVNHRFNIWLKELENVLSL